MSPAELVDLLRGSTVRMTCEVSPSQWEGETADGQHLYVRFRWGELTVGLGADSDQAIDNSAGWDGNPPAFSHQIGDPLSGQITWDGVLAAIASLAVPA